MEFAIFRLPDLKGDIRGTSYLRQKEFDTEKQAQEYVFELNTMWIPKDHKRIYYRFMLWEEYEKECNTLDKEEEERLERLEKYRASEKIRKQEKEERERKFFEDLEAEFSKNPLIKPE